MVKDSVHFDEGPAGRKPPQSGGGTLGRVFWTLIIGTVILGLGAAVLVLLSDLNHRRYRLNALGSQLVVERGRNLPFGYERFIPDAAALQEAYAPLPLPPKERRVRPEIFNDRADIDRALFALLAGWAHTAMESEDPKDLRRAATYIERSGKLPGLSEQQRVELRTLRADLAYKTGRQLLSQVVVLLNEALEDFKLAQRLGTSRPSDAAGWVAHLEQRISALGGRLPAATSSPLPSAPPSTAPTPPTQDLPPTTAPPPSPGGTTAPGIDPGPAGPTDADPVPAPEPNQPAPSEPKDPKGKWNL